MRRLVSEMLDYLSTLASTTRRAWNAFFFTPADPTPLGLIRIAAGLLAFWSLFVFGLDLNDYFGSHGWADPAVIRQSQLVRQPLAWSFWFLVPDSLLRPVWLVCLAVLGLYTAGLFSRITGVLAWVIVVSTVRRLPIALFGFDQVLSTLLFYLAVTFSSGQAISLDRFRQRWRQARAAARSTRTQAGGRRVSPGQPGAPGPTISANLALRLIQLHTAFIYGMAGLAKVQGPSWWNGMALWGTMTAGEFVSLDFTALANWPLVLNFLTHASLALELLYPILIWIRRAPAAHGSGDGWLTSGDRDRRPRADGVWARHDRGQSRVRVRKLAAQPGHGPAAAGAAGDLRRSLPALPGLDGSLDGGRSRPRCRSGRPDRSRCGDLAPGSHKKSLHGVDARYIKVGSSDGGFRRGSLAGSVAAGFLAARSSRLDARCRLGRPACI